MERFDLKAHFHKFEHWLHGWPNSLLTVMLLIAAAIITLVALFANPETKAIVAAYVFFP